MKRHSLHLFFGVVMISFILASCQYETQKADYVMSAPSADMGELIRIEQAVFGLETEQEVKDYLAENPLVARHYFKTGRVENSDALAQTILACAQYEPNATLLEDAKRAFKDVDWLRDDLAQAYGNVQHYFPEFHVPKVGTMVSGFGYHGFGGDLVMSDSLVVIGLDYFGGAQTSYRPPNLPNYLLARYDKPYIVPGVMRLLGDKFNQSDILDRTMLAAMIDHGKIYYFMEKMLPGTPDHILIGYTEQNIVDCEANAAVIWEFFTANKLFYETDTHKKRKLINEAPKTSELGEKAPGRIGQWLGWQIVRSYMRKHPEVSLAELMSDSEVKKIFSQSGYRPTK